MLWAWARGGPFLSEATGRKRDRQVKEEREGGREKQDTLQKTMHTVALIYGGYASKSVRHKPSVLKRAGLMNMLKRRRL